MLHAVVYVKILRSVLPARSNRQSTLANVMCTVFSEQKEMVFISEPRLFFFDTCVFRWYFLLTVCGRVRATRVGTVCGAERMRAYAKGYVKDESGFISRNGEGNFEVDPIKIERQYYATLRSKPRPPVTWAVKGYRRATRRGYAELARATWHWWKKRGGCTLRYVWKQS